jgi:hypothetical protein
LIEFDFASRFSNSMAIGTNLPPQAYTRETLTQAFAWLQTQPEQIRRNATTPESLVSLYTRNQRFGPENRNTSTAPISPLAGDDDLTELSLTEAPISAQNFKTDLKTLAEGLKQFEDPRGSRTQTHHATQTPQQVNNYVPQSSSQHVVHQAPQNQPHPVQQQLRAPPASFSPASATASAGLQALNPATQKMIEEVRGQLNLSSDLEAINMMVAIAYKNLKTLLA